MIDQPINSFFTYPLSDIAGSRGRVIFSAKAVREEKVDGLFAPFGRGQGQHGTAQQGQQDERRHGNDPEEYSRQRS